MQASDPMDGTSWWRVNIGNAIHDLVQREFAAMVEAGAKPWPEFAFDSEVRSGQVVIDGSLRDGGVALRHPISARTDALFIDRDGAKAGAEIKSTYGAGVQKMKDRMPEDRTLTQVLFYLALFGAERYYIPIVSRDDANRVLFVVSRKDRASCLAGYEVHRVLPTGDTAKAGEVPHERYVRALSRLKELEGYLERKELPEREFQVAIKNGEIKQKFQKNKVEYKSDWQCLYCSFKNKCWGERAESLMDGDNADEFAGRIDADELKEF